MTKNNNYLGFTIGPIVQTIASAKKTGHAWGGSYIFSYIMKQMIIKLKEKKINKEDFEILTPYVEENFKDNKYNAGLFPDRCILKVSKDFNKEKFEEIKNKVLSELANKIISKNHDNELKVDISKNNAQKKVLMNYFQIYGVIKQFESKKDAINTLTEYLDSLELEPNYQSHNPCNIKNPLFKFFENNAIKSSFLAEDCFGEDTKNMIKSLPEIALGNFIKFNDIKIDNFKDLINGGKYNEIYKKCAGNKNFKKHYKYYAILKADGDSVGKVLKNFLKESTNETKNNEDIVKYIEFSKKLFNFSKETVKIIENYGGLPIYIGGDDILAFVPLIYQDDTNNFKTIFGLIEDIDEKFDKKFGTGTINEKEIKPSLSYGLTINYYKYPLYEALNESDNLLLEKAKKCIITPNLKDENKKYEKNAVALKILKHSGQEIQITLNKIKKDEKEQKSVYKIFKELLKIISPKTEEEVKENRKILQSFKTKIAKDGVILNSLYNLYVNNGTNDFENNIKEFDNSIDNYFENNFKKDVHKSNEKQINNIKNLLKACYYEYPYNNSKKENNAIETFERILRVLSFLNERGE
ncbi:type III-B CRISPR-associated protein Cas10/Cmr2 [Methanococcus voltae]|uniref:CRISPR-associated protein, Crm2 family n=1 Tax=Methanococcus voltae (strain ATCC BAA-1334 / A3) TaxID=456320 RepID=D7DST4_METV3|nr:type III-B CRISPR-associated protein Cas10/Cmr2 [Methanococcus voltae]MCS3901795.1 CRISPR-associated protein Cmr2 [Methanococcus voltae]